MVTTNIINVVMRAIYIKMTREVTDKLNDCVNVNDENIRNIAEKCRQNSSAIEKQSEKSEDIQRNMEESQNEVEKIKRTSEESKEIVTEGAKIVEELQKQSITVRHASEDSKNSADNLIGSISKLNFRCS